MRKILSVLCAFFLLLGAAVNPPSQAQAETEREFDYVNVLDDLTGSADADGNAFDLSEYPYNENGRVQLVTLIEYCYSYAANMRGNYAVYLYFYNPTGREIDTSSILNVAQFAVGYNEKGSPDDYENFELKFCNKSTGDYNNLFYKFRVQDHESADGKTMAERVNSNARRYDLSSVELIYKGDSLAKDYGCGGTYTYKGYAAGYGSDADAATTLTCEVTDLETLDLEVIPTQYRPDGVFTDGHQDQLNSVYFAVPNDVLKKYGRQITEIKARWDEYKTGLLAVFDDKPAYDIFAPLVGKDMTQYASDYMLAGLYRWTSVIGEVRHQAGWIYNENGDRGVLTYGDVYNLLTAAFYTNGAPADTYSITSERMERALKEYSETADGDKINGTYSTDLFVDYVDEGHERGENVRTIDSETKYSLTAEVLNKNFWYKFLGIKDYESATYSNIKAIEEVTDKQLKLSDESLSKNLYIDPDDVSGFRQYCQAAEDTDKTVFIFRYSVTDYYATSIVSNISEVNESTVPWQECGYAAQQTVFLNFRIIQLKFYKDGVYTVIAAVNDPIDIIPGVTPPLPDKEQTNPLEVILRLLLMLGILFLAVVAVYLIIKIIISAVFSRQKISVEYKPPSEKISEIKTKEIEREVKANGGKKMPSKTGGSKSAPRSKTGNTGGKAPKQNTVARGGKADGKTKSTPKTGKNIRKGS